MSRTTTIRGFDNYEEFRDSYESTTHRPKETSYDHTYR